MSYKMHVHYSCFYHPRKCNSEFNEYLLYISSKDSFCLHFLNKCESMHTAMNIPIVLSDSQFRLRINKRDGVKRGE